MTGNYTMLYSALSPLYDFSHWFLGSVLQTTTLDDIANDIDLSDPGQIFQDFTSNWQFWVNYFLGFVVLAGLGIAFIIFFPISGICTCSCRVCCGNCGAKGGKKHSKCKNVCCCTWLFCFVTVILFGVVWSILANIALWEETKEGEGAFEDMKIHFTAIDTYRITTTDEIEQSVLWNFALTKNTIFSILDNAGPSLILNLGTATNAGPTLLQLQEWTDSLPELQATLQEAEETTAALQTNGNLLAIELATLQSDVSTDASLCRDFEQLCRDLEVMAANIGMGVDYDQLPKSQVTLALISITYAIDDDVWGTIETGVGAFLAVGDDINTMLEPQINEIKAAINTLEEELESYTGLVVNATEKISTANIILKIEDIEPLVDEYGMYWFWSCIAMSCVLGLIVLFYYWGLVLGTCCKNSCSCSRKTAAKCLVSANCCSFLFSWLLMLVTMAAFILGGPAYTEVCRHLTSLDSSATIDKIDDILTDALGFNLSISNTLAECRNNSPAYQALNLEENGVNISAIMDLDQYNIKEELDTIKLLEIDVGTVSILTEQANETLLVAATGLNSINFTLFYIILEKEVVTQDLEELAVTLDAAADAIAVGTLKQRFKIHANTSRSLKSGLVDTINTDRQTLYLALSHVEQQKNAYPLSEIIVNISKAQNDLNLYGNDYIGALLNDSVDELYLIMENGLNSLETTITEEVGKCESLYDAVVGIVDVVCVQVLDPFNAFWLAYGWSLWLLIPCVAMGYSLAGHYTQSLLPDDSEVESYQQFENPDVESSPPSKGSRRRSGGSVAPAPNVVHVQPKSRSSGVDWNKAEALS